MLIYILATIFAAGLVGLWVLSKLYVVAQPNQWMLVLRNGKLVKCGVGISCFQGLNDKVVKFPSKVHKVPFAAQQVTTEMQGVEVAGIIIWSIYREGDGPLKAYKSIGTDIQQEEPASANQNLVEMANGIVRHKIANSTIDQILKNRQAIREDVKKELNKNINGWGVWLETVEITDVKILSGSLFQNLQTEFRERQRQRAEIISMRVDSEMRDRRLAQNLETANKEAENETKKQIIRSNEQLRVNLERQQNYEADQEIQRQKLVRDQELKKSQAEAKAQLQSLVDANNHEVYLREVQLSLERQAKEEELSREAQELQAQTLRENLAIKNLREEAERANELHAAEMRRKAQEALPFDVYALERVREVMCSLPLQEVKVFNFSNGDGRASLGSALQQLLSEFQVIKGEVPVK